MGRGNVEGLVPAFAILYRPKWRMYGPEFGEPTAVRDGHPRYNSVEPLMQVNKEQREMRKRNRRVPHTERGLARQAVELFRRIQLHTFHHLFRVQLELNFETVYRMGTVPHRYPGMDDDFYESTLRNRTFHAVDENDMAPLMNKRPIKAPPKPVNLHDPQPLVRAAGDLRRPNRRL